MPADRNVRWRHPMPAALAASDAGGLERWLAA